MGGLQSSGLFIATDIASIPINDTLVNVTNFVAIELPVWDLDTIVIAAYCTGDAAACAEDITFDFVGSVDGVNWVTEIYYTLTITLVGVTTIEKAEAVNVLGFHSFRLQEIDNAETVGGRTASALNARWGKSYGGKLR